MKKFLGLFLLFVFLLTSYSYAKKRGSYSKRRSAIGKVRRSASGSKNRNKSKKEDTNFNSGNSKNDKESVKKKLNFSLSKEENSSIKSELACLSNNLNFLLEKDCKFLWNEKLLKDLSEDFYCLYNYKSSGNKKSVFDYYFYENYGIGENSVASDTSIISVLNDPVGTSAYYKELLEELSSGKLKETKILDFIVEDVLENLTVSEVESRAITSKSVEKVNIAMTETFSNIQVCKNAVKKVVRECQIVGNLEVKKVLNKNCKLYESLLVKQTSKLKADLLDQKQKLLDVLKERLVQQQHVKQVDKSSEKEAEDILDFLKTKKPVVSNHNLKEDKNNELNDSNKNKVTDIKKDSVDKEGADKDKKSEGNTNSSKESHPDKSKSEEK